GQKLRPARLSVAYTYSQAERPATPSARGFGSFSHGAAPANPEITPSLRLGDPRQALLPNRRSRTPLRSSRLRPALLGERVPHPQAAQRRHRTAPLPPPRRRNRPPHQVPPLQRGLHHPRRAPGPQERAEAEGATARPRHPRRDPHRRPAPVA